MGWILTALVAAVFAVLAAGFAYRNLHCDEALIKKVWAAGFQEKQEVLLDGTVLNYGEGGMHNRKALFLIHGQGQTWEDYDKVLPALAREYHVYAVDCHGHGESSHVAERYRLKLMTEDFVWFIRHVIGEPCVVSGHSSGGILAASVAASAPDLVSGVVLEDPPFFKVQPEEMQHTFVWLDSFLLAEQFQRQSKEQNFYSYYFEHGVIWNLFGNAKHKLARAAVKRVAKHPGKPFKLWFVPHSMLRGLYYREMYDQRFGDTFYDGSWFEGMNQEEILSSIHCPCIYLKAKTAYLTEKGFTYGDTEALRENHILCCANNDSDAKRVTQLVKDCKMIEMPTSDHLIHYKYPAQFIKAVMEVQKL